MKKRLYLKNKNLIFRCADIFISNQSGAILITLIVSMVVVAGLGSAMVSMFATSTYNQFGSSNSMKAHYLAESGKMIGIKYADDGGNITDLNGDIYTFSNGDTFKFSNTVYNSNTDFSFDSTGTTGGISRMISFARTIGSTNLASDPNNRLCNGQGADPDCGAADGDEPFDGDCKNRGYRSRIEEPNVRGNAYIGYDFQQKVKIVRIKWVQDEDTDNIISSIIIQGSDDSGFAGATTIYTPPTLAASYPNLGDPCEADDWETLDFPAYVGSYRYWRILADDEPGNPGDNNEWFVNEVEAYTVQDTQT